LAMQSWLFGPERWPAFDAFVVVSLPIGIIGSDAKERPKPKIGFVFEKNPNCAVVVHGRNFDSFNDLATDNGKAVLLNNPRRDDLSFLRVLQPDGKNEKDGFHFG
jgi:hypothetical protein